MALSDVKALTFDVFGTVVNWRDSIAREAKALLGPKGYDRDWHVFADKWRERYQPAMATVRNGERPWAKLDDLHHENLVELLRESEISGLSEADIDHLNRAWHRLDGWPDTVEGLTRLKRKYILATLSNGNVALMVNMAKHAGLPWDAILGAEVARAYKPQPEQDQGCQGGARFRPDRRQLYRPRRQARLLTPTASSTSIGDNDAETLRCCHPCRPRWHEHATCRRARFACRGN